MNIAIHFLAITSLQRYVHAIAAQMSYYCGNHTVSEVNPSKIKFPSNLNSVGKIIISSVTRATASGTAVVDAIFSDAIKLTEREPPRERAPR